MQNLYLSFSRSRPQNQKPIRLLHQRDALITKKRVTYNTQQARQQNESRKQMTSKILPDGSLYSGQWGAERTAPQGVGIRHFLSNRLYVGEWENGVMHGKGVLLLESGDLFEGHFSRGAFNGRGLLYSKRDGRTKRGLWKHGTLQSVEDIVGNADDANMGVAFRSAPGTASLASKNTPQFKLMELQAIAMVMRDLRSRLESSGPDSTQKSSSGQALLSATGGGSGGGGNNAASSALDILEGSSLRGTNTNNPSSNNNNNTMMMTTTINENTFMDGGGFIGGDTELSTMTMMKETNEPFGSSHQQQLQQQQQAAQHQQILSNQLLLTISGPSYNFSFSTLRFLQFLLLFLFPFFSLPGIPICPFRMDSLNQEREYVVSGAALRADFELPTWEIYCGVFGILFAIVGSVLPHDGTTIGSETSFSWSDIIVPVTLILIFALLNAAYQSYHRTAHALERLDRR